MKFKKLLVLIASVGLLASCGGTPSESSSSKGSESTPGTSESTPGTSESTPGTSESTPAGSESTPAEDDSTAPVDEISVEFVRDAAKKIKEGAKATLAALDNVNAELKVEGLNLKANSSMRHYTFADDVRDESYEEMADVMNLELNLEKLSYALGVKGLLTGETVADLTAYAKEAVKGSVKASVMGMQEPIQESVNLAFNEYLTGATVYADFNPQDFYSVVDLVAKYTGMTNVDEIKAMMQQLLPESGKLFITLAKLSELTGMDLAATPLPVKEALDELVIPDFDEAEEIETYVTMINSILTQAQFKLSDLLTLKVESNDNYFLRVFVGINNANLAKIADLIEVLGMSEMVGPVFEQIKDLDVSLEIVFNAQKLLSKVELKVNSLKLDDMVVNKEEKWRTVETIESDGMVRYEDHLVSETDTLLDLEAAGTLSLNFDFATDVASKLPSREELATYVEFVIPDMSGKDSEAE